MSVVRLQDMRERIRDIAAQHGVSHVRVFGSVCRGEDQPTSDIDLLVKLDSGRTLLDLIALKQELEDTLGVPVDVVTEAALSPYIREAVIKEALPL